MLRSANTDRRIGLRSIVPQNAGEQGSSGIVDLQQAMDREICHLVADIRDGLTVYLLKNLVAGSNFARSREAIYLGACAMQLMVWTLGHRAVASGEITEAERREQFAIGVQRAQGGEESPSSLGSPQPFSDLIERSHALRQRCERLDANATRRSEQVEGTIPAPRVAEV